MYMFDRFFKKKGPQSLPNNTEVQKSKSETPNSNHIEVKEHVREFLSFASATRGGTLREGRPKENEDCVLIGKNHLAVADGMGGHQRGKEASQTIMETFDQAFVGEGPLSLDAWQKRGERFINEAHSYLERKNAEVSESISGTTFTGAVLEFQQNLAENYDLGRVAPTKERSGEVFGMILHVGDSRAYILEREGNLKQITNDEDALFTLMLRQAGEDADINAVRVRAREAQEALDGLTQTEKASVLRKIYGFDEEKIAIYEQGAHNVSAAFGAGLEKKPFITFFQLRPGDTLLLQSDGLDVLTNEERKAIIEHSLDEAYAAEQLVTHAMQKVQEGRARGERIKDDDMSVALVRNTFEPTETE